MEYNEQNKLTNKIETQREQTDSCQRGEGLWKLGKKGEGIKMEEKRTHSYRQTTVLPLVITRGKGGWGQVEECKGEINGDRSRLDLGW